MAKSIDIKGNKYGRLTAVKYYDKVGALHRWVFDCDCGNTTITYKNSVKIGKIKSCGCLNSEIITKHGLCGSRFYRIYKGILRRCNNKNDHAYTRYGGRGIKCEWGNFVAFIRDMHELYEQHLELFGERNTTIDRINNDGNYCKENCRWATYKEQANNTSRQIINKMR